MNTVYIRNLPLGEGRPKICIPICGKTCEDILHEAEKILELPADIVEWRLDWYDEVFVFEKLIKTLQKLRAVLKERPLLCTFRTAKEGGEKDIQPSIYGELAEVICGSGLADAFDVELFMDEDIDREIIDMAHKNNVIIIASNHDFHKTPEKAELIRRMKKMDEIGADVLKIAVMPESKADVLELLSATGEMQNLYTEKPVITMSMGQTGLISRLTGELFGSVLTFGAGEKTSAPGQIPAKELETILDIIHEHMV